MDNLLRGARASRRNHTSTVVHSEGAANDANHFLHLDEEEKNRIFHKAVERQMKDIPESKPQKSQVTFDHKGSMGTESMKSTATLTNAATMTYEDRWKEGKKAAEALQRMLEAPPPAVVLLNEDRIAELRELQNSGKFMDKLLAYNGFCVMSQKFDAVMGVVILFNSVCIGLEQSAKLEDADTAFFDIIEHFFLLAYLIEFSMNVLESGLVMVVKDKWLRFDAFLCVLGVTTTWILEPILGSLEGAGPLMILRMLRLFRLARLVRLLQQFKELWTLVQGFMSSMNTMIYTSILLFMVMYSYACLGTEIIQNHSAKETNPEFRIIVDRYFCNLPRIMLTLLQFIAMDSVSSVYLPLVIEDGWLFLYFFGLILTVAIVLMNIVTAVIVNTALEANELDKGAKRAHQLNLRKVISVELGKMFELYAQGDNVNDGPGQNGEKGASTSELADDEAITLDELKDAPKEAISLLCELTHTETVDDLFLEIDLDGSGEVTLDEFTTGIKSIVCSEVPREIRNLHKDLALVLGKVDVIESKLDQLLGNAPATNGSASTRKSKVSHLNAQGSEEYREHDKIIARNAREGTVKAARQLLKDLDDMRLGAEKKLRSYVVDAEKEMRGLAEMQNEIIKDDSVKKTSPFPPVQNQRATATPKRNADSKPPEGAAAARWGKKKAVGKPMGNQASTKSNPATKGGKPPGEDREGNN